LRLAMYFETTPQVWLGLQNEYDLDIAAGKLGKKAQKVLDQGR